MGPRDQIVGATVPVNFETGQPLTVAEQMHMQKIAEAGKALLAAMHEANGSVPGDLFSPGSRMHFAAQYLDIAIMLARRAALEAR
jgi:hypothetical protein